MSLESIPSHYHFDVDISTFLSTLANPKRTLVVTTEEVWNNHKQKLKKWNVYNLFVSKEVKDWKTVAQIHEYCTNLQLNRHDTLVGWGGGAITDVVGFAAATYMRGMRCILIPSTLLAMVDAAVGGKNGIDSRGVKNLLGTIREPHAVLYDYTLLKSLPKREFTYGMAEVIKHACIASPKLFADLSQSNLKDLCKPENLKKMIPQNVGIKMSIVEQDREEAQLRKVLNFGHTLGHAFENAYHIPHGAAISIGMMSAALLSEKMCGFQDTDKLRALLTLYQLPTEYPFDLSKLWELLLYDKKHREKTLDFVLLRAIGQTQITPIDHAALRKMLRQLPNPERAYHAEDLPFGIATSFRSRSF